MGKADSSAGVYRVLDDQISSSTVLETDNAVLWNQHNFAAVLPPYANGPSGLISRREDSIFDSSLTSSDAGSTVTSGRAFLLSAGHWDWTFKASALPRGGKSVETNH